MGRNNICVIYDSDENYAKRLMSVINDDNDIPYNAQVFTKEHELDKYLQEKEADMLMICEGAYGYNAYRTGTKTVMGMDMPVSAIRAQISSAIDIIVHLARLRDKSRKVVQIAEVGNCINGEIALTPLFKFVENSQDKNGKVIGTLVRQNNVFNRTEKLEAAGFSEW